MSIGERIKAARLSQGLSVIELSAAAGISRQAMYDIESGETKSPMPVTLQAIARRLSADMDELISGPSSRGMEVREPEAKYPTASADLVMPNTDPPVVGTAQLGDDGYWLELDFPVGHGDGWVRYPSRDLNAYALRCKGDSMRPRIKPGEFVIVEPNHQYSAGDEVLIKDRRGRIMVKVYLFERDGVIEAGSVNEDHKPITIELEQIEHVHYVAAICKPSLYYRDIA